MLVIIESKMNATSRETSGFSAIRSATTLDLGTSKLNLLMDRAAEDNIWTGEKRKTPGKSVTSMDIDSDEVALKDYSYVS